MRVRLTDVLASIYDRKTATRLFDIIHDILRCLSLVQPLLKDRNPPIWRIGNQRVKTSMYVNNFQGSNLLLRDWDLWGPLLLCMIVGSILHEGEGGPHFTQFFVLFWAGSAVITLNSKLLGGTISFFQSVK